MIGFELTPGQRSDIGVANSLLATLPKAEHVLGETAYDGDGLRALLAERGSTAVIKPDPTRKNVPAFGTGTYKLRNLIERTFAHLKDWRRVSIRYDKLARNLGSTVAPAAIIFWWT